MPHSLHSQLARIRRRVRCALWLYGLSWLVVVVLGAALIAGLLDWRLHLDDAGMRLMIAIGIVSGGCWIAWRKLISPLRNRFSDADIASRIEKRFPRFQESLSSTVQFVEARANPRLGSPEMQQRVIAETMQQVEEVDIGDMLQTRAVRRIGVIAVLIASVVFAVVGWNRVEAAVAFSRLVFPFSGTIWPKKDELRIVDANEEGPLRIALGAKLEVYVENLKGPLPDDTVLEYRFDEDDVRVERLRNVILPDKTGQSQEAGVGVLVASKGPIWFRAVGGDDHDMAWYAVDVIPQPVVDELQVILTPPAYTGRSTVELPGGVGHFEGLVGTRVDLSAVSSKRLSSVKLQIKDRPTESLALGAAADRFTASFMVSAAGATSYWFELTDEQGFHNEAPTRYEIQAIADQVPDLYIDEPASDLDVTAEAIVPLRIIAKDDLGLRAIRLSYKLGDSAGEPRYLPLFTGDDRPQQETVDFEWELAQFSLREGDRIEFLAEATDDYDLGPPHVGQSLSRTLTVVSKREKQAEFDARQGDLLSELERIEQIQRQAHEQVEELLLQLEKVGKLSPADVDILKRVELDQRQITGRLFDPADGVDASVRELQREMRDNAIDDAATNQRLGQIAEELQVVREEHMPQIESMLTRARKSIGVEADPEEDGPSQDKNRRESSEEKIDQTAALDTAHEHQNVVLESLSAMLEQLSRWSNQRDLTGEVNELIVDQNQLNRESAELGRKTLTKSLSDLTPQEQADLSRLARRQRQQSGRVSRFNEKLGKAIQRPTENRSDDADVIQDARDLLQRSAIASRMQDSADQLENNKVGRAATGQQQILDDLNELQQLLENRGVSDTEELVKQLKQAEDDLEKLAKRQEELLKKNVPSGGDQAQDEPLEELLQLRKQQQQLRNETEGIARRLRRLQARDPSASSRRAAARMESAERNLTQGDSNQAESEQQEALEDLQQAQRELAQERQQVEEQLAYELLEKIVDQLQGMIAREQSVIDETKRLDEANRRRGNWSRGQLKSLRQLAEHQQQLKQETDRLADSLKAAEVFALALRGAARQMQRAAERISNRQTDEQTVRVERRAKQRFLDLVSALKRKQRPQAAPQADAGGDGGEPIMMADGVPQLAQLRMLKTMQQELQHQTGEFDEIRRRAGELTEDQQAELDRLADEQGQLADLARNLMQAVLEAFEVEDDEALERQEIR